VWPGEWSNTLELKVIREDVLYMSGEVDQVLQVIERFKCQ